MPTIRVKPGQLGNVLTHDAQALSGSKGKILKRAMYKAAHRARAAFVMETDVDRGMLKASWDVIELVNANTLAGYGYEVINTAPYAGVVERGIRPGAKFGRVAHEAIKGWVIRKGLAGKHPRRQKTYRMTKRYLAAAAAYDREADSIAWAIIKKLEKLGRQGKFKVQKMLPALNAELAKYIVDEINKYFAAGGGSNLGGP